MCFWGGRSVAAEKGAFIVLLGCSNFLKTTGGSATSRIVELYIASPKTTPIKKNSSEDSNELELK